MILVQSNKVEKIKYFSTLLGLIFIEIPRGPSPGAHRIYHANLDKILTLNIGTNYDRRNAQGRCMFT